MTIRRSLAILGFLLLGAVSASLVEVRYEPEVRRSDITVWLRLPESTSRDAERVGLEWSVPLESIVRGLGEVDGMRSSVSPDGVWIRVRFRPGADVRKKIARLGTDLAALRARLPRGGAIQLFTGQRRESAALLFLTGETDSATKRRVRDALRVLPSVRELRLSDGRRDETVVTIENRGLSSPSATEISEAIRASGAVTRLGRWSSSSRRVPVDAIGASGSMAPHGETRNDPRLSLDSLPIVIGSGTERSIVRLGAVANIERGLEEARGEGRWNGEPAMAISVSRHDEIPVLRFDRELSDAIARLEPALPAGAHLVRAESEARAVRHMLRSAALAGCVAFPLMALFGWWNGGRRDALLAALYVPLAVALIATTFHLTGIPLDVATLPAAWLAVACAAPMALMRRTAAHDFQSTHANAFRTESADDAKAVESRRSTQLGPVARILLATVSASLLVVAVAIATGALAPYLAPSAKAFLLATLAASIGAALVTPSGPSSRTGDGRLIRRTLREAGTVLLAASAVAFVLFTLFGKALDPRSAGGEEGRSRLVIRAPMPEGSTLEQGREVVELVEGKLALVEGIASTWGWVEREEVLLIAEVAASHRSPTRFRELTTAVRMRLELASGGTIRVDDSTAERQGNSVSAFAPFEETARTDDEATMYRGLLRGSDVEALENAVERVRGVVRSNSLLSFQSGLGARSLRIELRPAPAGGPDAARLARAMTRATSPGEVAWESDDEIVRVRGATSPRTAEDVPSRRDLLQRTLVADGGWLVALSNASPFERVSLEEIPRQSGRFLVPFTIYIRGADESGRRTTREAFDRSLSVLALPRGVDMERPEIRPLRFSVEKWRMIALVAALPALIALLSAIWMNSPWKPVAALLPLAIGIALAATFVQLSRSRLDEMALALVAAAVCGALPGLLMQLRAPRAGEAGVATAYRRARAAAAPMLAGSVVALAALAAPAIAADAVEDAWAVPLGTAGVALAGAFAAGTLLPAATLFSVEALRRRRSAEFRRKRRPPEWDAEGTPSLLVSHVSKTYRGGGVRALHDVSFELRPGVVGLLGPNGAGKTTLLRIMTGLLRPNRGELRYRGVAVESANLARYRQHIGFLPQDFNAYPGFTATQFLDYWAMEHGMTDRRRRAEEIELLLAAVGLEEHANRKVRDFSGGMKQRIGIARALLGEPEIVVVDEPTTGLDIEGRSRFRGLILSIAAHRIVVLSTHIAGDIEATCSRVLLLHRGALRFDGAPSELVARAEGQVFECVVSDHEAAEISRSCRITRRVRVIDGVRLRGVVPPGHPLPGTPASPSLEEAYLLQTGIAEVAAGGRKFAFLRASL